MTSPSQSEERWPKWYPFLCRRESPRAWSQSNGWSRRRNLLTEIALIRIIMVPMPPLTTPDRPLKPAYWRLLLMLACGLVFSFALHAKVAVYGHSQPQASTASRLWVSGAKFESPTTAPSPVLFWLAAILICLLGWLNSHRLVVAPVAPTCEQRRRQYLHRCLRPPPSR